jgi:hypothetical protein
MTGTHVLIVADQRGQWADVLGPFPDRPAASAFRRRLAAQVKRRGYFGLHDVRLLVTPLLSTEAYEDARTAVRQEVA